MICTSRWLSSLLLAALLPAQQPQAETLLDEWAIMRMEAVDVGYLHTQVVRRGEGDAVRIEMRVASRLKMNRLGSEVSIDHDLLTVEREDGSLVRIESASKMSSQESASTVEFTDGEARITTRLMGRERTRSVACSEQMIGPYRLLRLLVEKGLEPGTEWSAVTFLPDLMQETEVYTRVVGPEAVDIDGAQRQLVKVVSEMDAMPVEMTSWVGADGMAVKSLMPIAGLRIEMLVTDAARAKAALGEGRLGPDLFAKTMIVAKSFVPEPRFVDAAVIDIRPKQAGAEPGFPTSARQVIEREASGRRTAKLRRLTPPAGGNRPLVDPAAELQSSLASNTMIQCDAPEIRAIAEQVVGAENDAWRAAQTLERWVYDNVTEKGFGVGFASALEVCRERAGDCSEHAVLLAALCRAAGIPARVAMGVMYLGGVWAGHAWNEVWIDGEWYALDGTLGYGSVDPLHLTMVSMTMDEGSGGDEFAALLASMGRFDLQVREVARAGRTLPLEPEIDADRRRYVHRGLGFSCAAPAGFTVEAEQPSARIQFKIAEIEGRNAAEQRCRIEISAFARPAGADWDDLARLVRSKGDAETITVDGRPARLLETTLGQRSRVVLVDVGRSVWAFGIGPIEGEADRATLAGFLESVDFDVGS